MKNTHPKLIIIGCGGTAEMIADLFIHDSIYDVIAFSAEKRFAPQIFMGKPVIEYEVLDKEFPNTEYSFFVAIGESNLNQLRYRFYSEMIRKGYQAASFISSKSSISSYAKIGNHCFIAENVVAHAGCTIGDNVIILPNCYIGHHSVIESHTFFSAGVNISGFSHINEFTFLGTGSSISNCINIGKGSVIGIGAVCSSDIGTNEIVTIPHNNIRKNARDIFCKWHDNVAHQARTILQRLK